jgi:plasmid stability protein
MHVVAIHPYLNSTMKTTLNIDETVMQRLREEAARRGTTMSALVEAGLRRMLDEESVPDEPLPELPAWDGGAVRVDIADRNALLELMEDT